MTIVVNTPTSQRLDRVVGDIMVFMHARDADAKARALRWVAHVLSDANARRKWWFLEKTVTLTLLPGQDILQFSGDIDKVAAVFGPGRLEKIPLAQVTRLRMNAAARTWPNAGTLSHYALEAGKTLHLWPAPAGTIVTFTADAATDLLTLASAVAPSTSGAAVRGLTTGTLPSPMALATTYYTIAVSTTTIKLASTKALAEAGTAIDLADAGSGTHTLTWPPLSFATLYTRPMDMAIVPDEWETLVLNGVLGMFGRHFDKSQLVEDAGSLERRYERQLRTAGRDSHDIERALRWDNLPEGDATVTADSASNTATSLLVPASLTGIGYVTIETGDYPLVVQ